jgi:hypothetical protein
MTWKGRLTRGTSLRMPSSLYFPGQTSSTLVTRLMPGGESGKGWSGFSGTCENVLSLMALSPLMMCSYNTLILFEGTWIRGH